MFRGLVSVVVPEPPPWVANEEPAPVFVRFDSEAACVKVKEAMNGRTFEANTVTAKYISDELWQRVKGGEWVDHKFVIDNPTGATLTPPRTGCSVSHSFCFHPLLLFLQQSHRSTTMLHEVAVQSILPFVCCLGILEQRNCSSQRASNFDFTCFAS